MIWRCSKYSSAENLRLKMHWPTWQCIFHFHREGNTQSMECHVPWRRMCAIKIKCAHSIRFISPDGEWLSGWSMCAPCNIQTYMYIYMYYTHETYIIIVAREHEYIANKMRNTSYVLLGLVYGHGSIYFTFWFRL